MRYIFIIRLHGQVKPEWGRYTQNGKKLYAHIFEESIGAVNLEGLGGKINKVRLLHNRVVIFSVPVLFALKDHF